MIPTVIVGGHDSIVTTKIIPQLRDHGLEVIRFVSWDAARISDLPLNTRVIFLMTDMVSHRLYNGMKSEAEGRNIKIVFGTRKATINRQRLSEAGFPHLLQTTPIPVDEPPAEVEVKTSSVINNPRLPWGFYTGILISGNLDAERATVMLLITYGPTKECAGQVYTDTLITRQQYENGGPLDKMVELLRSANFKSNESKQVKKAFENDEMAERPIYFRLFGRTRGNKPGPTEVAYLEKTAWMLTSARQRKKGDWAQVADQIAVPPHLRLPSLTAVLANAEPETFTTAESEEVLPPEPEPPTPENPMNPLYTLPAPSRPHPLSRENEFTTSLSRQRYRTMLHLLAEDPSLTSSSLARKMDFAIGQGFRKVWDVCREVLGIESVRSGVVSLHRATYEDACRQLGLVPVPWTHLRRMRSEDAADVESPATPAASTPVPVEVTPVTPPSVALGLTEAQERPRDLRDLKEIILLLREEMARQDMRRLVITPTEVEFTRVVTVEGKLEI